MANINITLQGLKISFATDTQKKNHGQRSVKNGNVMLKVQVTRGNSCLRYLCFTKCHIVLTVTLLLYCVILWYKFIDSLLLGQRIFFPRS